MQMVPSAFTQFRSPTVHTIHSPTSCFFHTKQMDGISGIHFNLPLLQHLRIRVWLYSFSMHTNFFSVPTSLILVCEKAIHFNSFSLISSAKFNLSVWSTCDTFRFCFESSTAVSVQATCRSQEHWEWSCVCSVRSFIHLAFDLRWRLPLRATKYARRHLHFKESGLSAYLFGNESNPQWPEIKNVFPPSRPQYFFPSKIANSITKNFQLVFLCIILRKLWKDLEFFWKLWYSNFVSLFGTSLDT